MKCPVCGVNMDMNLRKDENFVQDEHWYEMSQRYDEFLNKIQNKNVVLLEIGVGFNNTLGIIRFPFEQMTANNLRTTLIRINKDYPSPMLEMFIWANWRVWDDFAFEMKEGDEKYDFAISQVLKQEEATISTQLCGFDAPGVLAVSISKMINSEEFFSHVLKTCEKGNYKGPITFIPSNEISQYC